MPGDAELKPITPMVTDGRIYFPDGGWAPYPEQSKPARKVEESDAE